MTVTWSRYMTIAASSESPLSWRICIIGGRVLTADGLQTDTTLTVEDGRITAIGGPAAGARCLDARGLLVLPGIVDVHRDAFERQLMPPPGVHFDTHPALGETDRPLIFKGVTTPLHALTHSL